VLYGLGLSHEICITAAITSWVAAWWITEPIPIPATSLIPLALFPLFGILSPDDVARAYGNKLVLLMLGGFMLSAAMERSGAHRRIALGMVNLFGRDSGRGLVFGFMLASAVLSMWISNAATTLMLLPIAMAVVAQTSNRKTAGCYITWRCLWGERRWRSDADWNSSEFGIYGYI
jgi:sodium-dependent dicarboxylate transporter 2/3/5